MRCYKKFNIAQGLYQHFSIVHRERNFQYAQCSRLFSTKFLLKRHLNVCFDDANEQESKLEISGIRKDKLNR